MSTKEEINIETITVSNWKSIPNAFYKDAIVKNITEEIMEEGIVICYFKLYSGDFVSLPLRFYQTDEHTATIDAVIKLNIIRIIWMNTALESGVVPPKLKIKIITLTKRLKLKYPDINFKNFKVVCARFNLLIDERGRA